MDRNANRESALRQARENLEAGRGVLEKLRNLVAECDDLQIAIPAEVHDAIVAASAPRIVNRPAPFGVRA